VGGAPPQVFTQSALQKATLDKAFVNERFVRRSWDARRFANLDAETREAIPPVVLVDAPNGARQRVMKPERVFEAVNSVRFASSDRDASGKGGDAFACVFCAFINTALATLCAASDVRLLCAPVFDETVGEDAPVAAAWGAGDIFVRVAVFRVAEESTPGSGGWACAVARGNAVQAVLAFGVGSSSKPAVRSSVSAFFAPLGAFSMSADADIVIHADSSAEDACARACAAAWTAACFREQEFVSIWQQTQWPSDGFVAGATRCEEAARMALAHAVVGCSSSLAKGLAARKLLGEAILFEKKARRIKVAAVYQETDARRIFMANQMEKADATRIAMANLPDDFPLLDYPHNTSHHMYLWSPNL